MSKRIMPELARTNFFRDHWEQVKGLYSHEDWREGTSGKNWSLLETLLFHWETGAFANKNKERFLKIFKELIQEKYIDPLLPQIQPDKSKEPLNLIEFLWEAHGAHSSSNWLVTQNKIGEKMLMECLVEGYDIDKNWMFNQKCFVEVIRTHNLDLLRMYVDKVKDEAQQNPQTWNVFSKIVMYMGNRTKNSSADVLAALNLGGELLHPKTKVSGFETLLGFLYLNPDFAPDYDQWLLDHQDRFEYKVEPQHLSDIQNTLFAHINVSAMDATKKNALSRILVQLNQQLSPQEKQEIAPPFSMEYRSFSKKWRSHWASLSSKKVYDMDKIASTFEKNIFNLEFFLLVQTQLSNQQWNPKKFRSLTVLALMMLWKSKTSLSQSSATQGQAPEDVQKSFLNAFRMAIALEKPKFNQVPVATSNVAFNMNKWFDEDYDKELRQIMGSPLISTLKSPLIQNLLSKESRFEFENLIEVNRLYETVKKIKKEPEPKPALPIRNPGRF